MKQSINLVLLLLGFFLFGQENYKVTIDLTNVVDDKVKVEIIVPESNKETVEYHMPKIVPGTYSISDFGRFINDFKAFNDRGESIPVNREDVNRWSISGKSLNKITYWVEDTFDDFKDYGTNRIFEPGGTNIDGLNNVYVINTFGFIGYLDGLKFKPYELTILHHPEIAGATALEKISVSDSSDTYYAANYNFLADGPLMYCKPDVVSKKIAGADILVSVYSPNKSLSANDVMSNIEDLMIAQSKYLGDSLPIDRYAYLIYLFKDYTLSGSYGALEHSYSSFYSLQEMDAERIGQIVRDVAAHEFFHIVTPLNLHSKEIHDFDYIDPKMSQHLWLYEGMTEYASHHVQVKYQLYSLEDFLNELRNKIIQSEQYNIKIPYTQFSKNILESKNERRFGDVYSGGALIAMCLDLTIIKSTNGKMDLQKTIAKLSQKYGPMNYFDDDSLFNEIENVTTPEVGDFLKKYIKEYKALPLRETLEWAGIDYLPEREDMVITAGKFTPSVNENQAIYIASTNGMNQFGKNLGFEEGDILISWNDQDLTIENFTDVIQKFYDETNEGDKVSIRVKRIVKGKEKEIVLKADAMKVSISEKHSFRILKDISEDQYLFRTHWLNMSNPTK